MSKRLVAYVLFAGCGAGFGCSEQAKTAIQGSHQQASPAASYLAPPLDPSEKPTPPLSLTEPRAPSKELGGRDLSTQSSSALQRAARAAETTKDYRSAIQLRYWAVVKHGASQYQLACYYGLDNAVEPCLYWLQRSALEQGVDAAWAQRDTDLTTVRQDSRWPAVAEFLRKCNAYWAANGPAQFSLVLPTSYVKDKAIPVVIGLPGLGDNPANFVDKRYQAFADKLGVAFLGVSGALPRGPKTYAWSPDHTKNIERIDAAVREVSDRLTPANGQLVLFGFSQGGQAAVEVAVRFPQKCAGALVLGPGGLGKPTAQVFLPTAKTREQRFVLLCGTREEKLTASYAQLLQHMGERVEYHADTTLMEHTFPRDYWEKLDERIRFILQLPNP